MPVLPPFVQRCASVLDNLFRRHSLGLVWNARSPEFVLIVCLTLYSLVRKVYEEVERGLNHMGIDVRWNDLDDLDGEGTVAEACSAVSGI